ncbi:uncharacterized protein TNCV_3678351 [Trichonephila clavipes]|nr:uncharacterized protein TNCV_3678351 [Trichonephila clavipes]
MIRPVGWRDKRLFTNKQDRQEYYIHLKTSDCSATELELQQMHLKSVETQTPLVGVTDEAHFHLEGTVSMHNCRIWAGANPHQFLQILLRSSHVTVWCGFTATFTVSPFFTEQNSAAEPVTCTLTCQRYASSLEQSIIPTL